MNRNYSLYTPTQSSSDTLIFAAGMACNRFGHPCAAEPTGIFADIATMASSRYNILFVDVHDMGAENAPLLHEGTTVEFQSRQIAHSINDAFNGEAISGKLYFVGQSLGSLAIIHYLRSGPTNIDKAGIFMIAPPACDGMECRRALASMFTKNNGTLLNERCVGRVRYGDRQEMIVSEEYWTSIEENTISQHSQFLGESAIQLFELYATADKYFPQSEHYLRLHTPDAFRIAVTGSSHAFKPHEMRSQAVESITRFLPAH